MKQRFASGNTPLQPPAAADVAPAAPADGHGAGAEAALQEGVKRVQQQFKALLQGDSELGAEQREHMERFFEQALQDASTSTAPISEDVFDRATWTATVDELRRNGGIAADEADHLIRSLNDALAPLERRESKLAIEFSRRLASDGEQEAIAWLRSKQAETDDAAQSARDSVALAQGDGPPLRNEVVNSRSRRLRGPPK